MLNNIIKMAYLKVNFVIFFFKNVLKFVKIIYSRFITFFLTHVTVTFVTIK